MTYSVEPVVRVCFYGISRGEYRTREDHGLVARFLDWQAETKTFPIPRSGGVSGGGIYVGYFPMEHMGALSDWFRQQGIEEEPNA